MKLQWVAFVALAVSTLGCETIESIGENEEDVALSDVPLIVIEAAKEAVPGITLTEAEMEIDDGEKIYEVEGTADGKEYEIEISAAGEVLEIEEDDDD